MHDFTRAWLRWATLTVLSVGVLTTSLAAQDHRFALGVTGSRSWPGDLTPGFEEPTELESGWSIGFQAETWLGTGRYGIRASGSQGSRNVEGSPGQAYDVLVGDIALLVRPLPAAQDPWGVPYLSGGVGAARFSADDGTPPLGNGEYGDDPIVRPSVVIGAGVDLLPVGRIGVRLEAMDRIVFPSVGESPPTSGLPFAHNLELAAALQVRLQIPRPATLADVEPARTMAEEEEPDADEDTVAEADPEQAALEERTARLEAERERERARQAAADSAAAAQAQEETPLGTPVDEVEDAAAEAADAVEAVEGSLFTVQVGGLMEAETARRWEERLRAMDLPVWLSPVEIQGQRLIRVRAGALPSDVETQALADLLATEFGWPTAVDRIGRDEPMPTGAVSATRAFLRGP